MSQGHRGRDGKTKFTYETYDRAIYAATWLFERKGRRLRPYRCGECRAFHLRRIHRNRRFPAELDFDVLGERVMAHLRRENHKRVEKRHEAIVQRFRQVNA
jgi:hypothetical protein